jgi:hypothetical protein
MSQSDYYADGQWNFFCDLCGRKAKSSDGVKTWDNFYVCSYHKEARNPQDFVRGIKDNQSTAWSRVEAPDTFVPMAWTRRFDDIMDISEVLAKSFSKVIPFTFPGTGINSYALDAFALNAPVTPSGQAAEALAFSETVKLSSTKPFVDALPVTEVFAKSYLKVITEFLPLSETVYDKDSKTYMEAVPFAEVIALRPSKPFTDAFTFTEVVKFYPSSPRVLNQSALNSSALG